MTYYDSKDLKDILIYTIRYANYEDLYIQSKIEKKWNDISGMMLDKAVKIESFKKGVLTLKVVSSTWRSELILRKNRIIKELNNELGNDMVTELIIH